jgi:molybdate transport system regulatory protein
MIKLLSSHILVNENNDIIMGAGRLAILESIDRTGSINQTAKELNMSYKSVWSKIKSTESHFGKPVVLSDRTSGTCLTREGKKLARLFNALKQQCITADDLIFKNIFD